MLCTKKGYKINSYHTSVRLADSRQTFIRCVYNQYHHLCIYRWRSDTEWMFRSEIHWFQWELLEQEGVSENIREEVRFIIQQFFGSCFLSLPVAAGGRHLLVYLKTIRALCQCPAPAALNLPDCLWLLWFVSTSQKNVCCRVWLCSTVSKVVCLRARTGPCDGE